MNFLEKIENAINFLLIKLGELMLKAIPSPVKKVFAKLGEWCRYLADNFRQLPALTKSFLLALMAKVKSSALSFDYKAALLETHKKAMAQYKEKSPDGMGAMKKFFMTPFLMMGQWLQGLSPSQSLLLLTFSCASILSVIGIGFSGHKLMHGQSEASRTPASATEEVLYQRPDYYKKQTRFLELTNLRLPVYVANVNEIKSVDIDFSATMTNRNSRMFLEKHEFHLRDHLILQMEPSVASFPLEEEGKEIIRKKLLAEINDFLKINEVDGEVLELKITYVLAN